MMKKLFKRIVIYTLIYTALGLSLYLGQNKFLYFPSQSYDHGFKNITIENDNCKINVIVVNSEQHENALIYFGGNAEAVERSANDFQKSFPNTASYLVNYRGYGRSNGHPSEQGIYSDATKIYELVKSKHSSISVIGRSLGTGVATFIASTQDIKRLVLVTPYDSILSIAKSKFFMFPMSLIVNQKYLSINRVNNIKCKCLALIAETDKMIAYRHSESIVNEFPKEQIEAHILKGTGHNTISNSPEYFKLISSFIR